MKKFFVIFISLFVLFGCCSSNNTRPGATYNGSNSNSKENVRISNENGIKPRKVEGGGVTYIVGRTPNGYPIYRFDYEGRSYLIMGHDCIIEINE